MTGSGNHVHGVISRAGLVILFASISAACGGGGGNGASAGNGGGGAAPSAAISLFAGNAAGAGNVNGTGANASFNSPTGVAIAANGNLYVADGYNNTIRMVTAAGVVTTFAGRSWFDGSADGTGAAAGFSSPVSIAIDSTGNLYVGGDFVIRKISPAGVVSTIAGEAGVAGSTDGQGVSARFSGNPWGIAVDGSGNVFVADTNNNTIRKINAAGNVSTFAGTAGVTGSSDGTGSAASFSQPMGIAVDASGNLFVADNANCLIRKITAAAVVSTFAGTAGSCSSADGTGTGAGFSAPTGLTIDTSGNLYLTDRNSIRKITPAAVVTTLAGVAETTGSADGTGSAALFNLPVGLAVDGSGNLYVVDGGNDTLRKVTGSGQVTTIAGSPPLYGMTNATGSAARFNNPQGLATDSAGNVYVGDEFNLAVRKITPGGTVSTLPGAGTQYLSPIGLATDIDGNLYIADSGLNHIAKVTSAGAFSVLAGSGTAGSADGTGPAASFHSPSAIAVAPDGTLYVADSGNDTIRKVTSSGVVTTLAGSPGMAGSADGTGSTARFNNPLGITVDASGNIFVSDSFNNTIREITPSATVTTLAGVAGVEGDADGNGAGAGFFLPIGIMVDTDGNLVVADYGNATIRKVATTGTVTTVAGVAGTRSFQPGGLPGLFSYPVGLAQFGSSIFTTTNNAIVQISNFP